MKKYLSNSDWEKIDIYQQNIKMKKETLYIVVLAGGLKETGEVHDFVKYRLDKASEIFWEEIKKRNCKIICMGGGTYHKPPILNKGKFVIHESSSCAHYLLSKGIPPENLLREWASYDTIANGYFCFLNYIIPLEIKDIKIITSQFHMPRTKTIFNYFNSLTSNNVSFEYIETENTGISDQILKFRSEKENSSKILFEENIVKKINSMKDFTEWFYLGHNAYKSIIQYKNNDKINKTY